MAGLTVRTFEPRDEEQVVTLWSEAFRDDPARNEPRSVIRRKLAVQPELFVVGESDGRVVAAALAGYDGFRGWVYHLAVDAVRRRRGFGGAMMAELERRLEAMGCPKINLQVRSHNRSVVAFYESLGYEVEDHVSLGRELSAASRSVRGDPP